MMFPAAYQVPAPFGVDFGGVDPALSAIRKEAEFDSYLTLCGHRCVGSDNTVAPGAMAASPGLGLEAWTEDAGFSTSNGALFYMCVLPDGKPLMVVVDCSADLNRLLR